jgi:Ni,Fe-hydrogenase III large subunit
METLAAVRYAIIRNQQTIELSEIPVLPYGEFVTLTLSLLKQEHVHCINYYAYPEGSWLRFICCLADDQANDIKVLRHEMPLGGRMQLLSLTRDHYPMHIFEREITENFGVEFIYHPWKKPVRYAFNRADRKKIINTYPFYRIDSDELHEVGVGPIHAGIIEPGHFRFLCNGETVLHLEIQLGWQHRGVESLFLSKPKLLQRTILSESIAGDTTVGHTLAFVSVMESLGGITVSERLHLERTLALEMERLAMHVGDLSNMNIGMAYQLGASVLGALRTPAINLTQLWCGNRFGKSLIRAGGSHFPLTDDLTESFEKFLDNFEKRFRLMADKMFSLPSILMRMENIGKVTRQQMELIGAVGMTARMAGMERDIRKSHPFSGYTLVPYDPVTLEQGDVWARAMLRKLEVDASLDYMRKLLDRLKGSQQELLKPIDDASLKLAPDSLTVSLVEGWRGEICHCVVTDSEGKIIHYKVKDPSVHNWMALALSLRDLEISDFPINNKSYSLSYCGHDL